MKTSPMQLKHYFVTDLNVTTNRQHKSDKAIQVSDTDLNIEPNFLQQEDTPNSWQVTLRVQLQTSPETNAPYYFMVELVGYFSVTESYSGTPEWLVRTNAPSVLYSTAREVLRNAMSQGPFCPLLLPTASFYDPESFKLLDHPKEAEKQLVE